MIRKPILIKRKIDNNFTIMKKIILTSCFVIITSLSAFASPTLEQTIDFIINGDSTNKREFQIENCVLTYNNIGIDLVDDGREFPKKNIIDLKKTNLNTVKETKGITPDFQYGPGVLAECTSSCYQAIDIERNEDITGPFPDMWDIINGVSWDRNVKALEHLFSNFCEPTYQPAF